MKNQWVTLAESYQADERTRLSIKHLLNEMGSCGNLGNFRQKLPISALLQLIFGASRSALAPGSFAQNRTLTRGG
jgi:hypothetical protein